MAQTQGVIPKTFSVYLDCLRFTAALIVIFYHTWELVFPLHPLPWPGHAAVVVFFVLSGYVISHAAIRPGMTAAVYTIHRAARILPVTIIALLLSASIEPFAGTTHIPNAGNLHPLHFWRDTAVNAFFLGQGWVDVAAPLNAPFWSLNMEVWYYVIFGAWIFSPPKWRVAVTVLAVVIAGPKALLLFPVWLLGVALHKWMPTLSQRHAKILFATTAIAGIMFVLLNVSINIRTALYSVLPTAMSHLGAANQFVGDFLLGLIVTSNLIAAYSLGNVFKPLLSMEPAIRFLSSFTFSTYLFHMPMVVLIWNIIGIRAPWLLFVLLALGIYVLGQLTERRTNTYRNLFDLPPVATPAAVQKKMA